jgi:Tol biopolymer transport system component
LIGKTLAHYEITGKLGEGGMGEVYQARDTTLGREVAIKVLPPEMSEDPERLARFDREARSLAALHHPNVASIFGFEAADGIRFLVMEYVEGEDLQQRLERGPISIEDATDIARQMALGLEAAHGAGIVHRDLKPANVRLTTEGQVKILDFGLARGNLGDGGDLDRTSGSHTLANSPTMTAAMTQHGLILGTAAYMSPEQARGKTVDHRADIWAFGVILWDMLSGQRLFGGDTITDILANVLKHDVDMTSVPADTPVALRRLLARCLARDPRKRLHSIADARLELEDDLPASVEASGMSDLADRPTATRSRIPWLLVAALAAACLVLMWRPWALATTGAPTRMALSIEIPEPLEISLNDWAAMAVSDDGKMIAVTVREQGQLTIQVRKMSEPGFQKVSVDANASGPFFSPDSRWVGYYSDSFLWKVSVDGGASVKVAPTPHPRGAVWGDDGYVYYAPGFSTGISRRSESGTGEEEVLTVVDTESGERTHRWPEVLPNGRGIVFTVGTTKSPGNYEDSEIAVYDGISEETRHLGIQGAYARWSPSGHLLVMRNGVLHAVDFNLQTLEITSAPIPVFDSIRGDPASGAYYFDVTPAGDLFYVPDDNQGPQRTLVWVDRNGNTVPLGLAPGMVRYPHISPDGKTATVVMGEGHGNFDDVYLVGLNDASLTRLTFDQTSIMPHWEPTGQSIVYSLVAEARLMAKDISGAGERKVEDTTGIIVLPGSVGSNGRILLSTSIGNPTLGDIYVSDLKEPGNLRPVINSPAAEWGPDLSPNEKWVVYCSDETGREEIFVQPYPTTGAKWQVSTDGGRAPRWSHKGDEIFFVEGDTFYATPVKTSPAFRAGTPAVLFTHRMDTSGVPTPNYDVSNDDQRFLIVEADSAARSRQLRVVLGWLDSLEGLER